MFWCVSAAAQTQPSSTLAYRNYLQAGVESGAYQQVAAGWIDGSGKHTWFFGANTKPDADSVFEIGAVTEVFTGLLLAQAAYTGKLSLDATLHTLLPSDFGDADATLASLLVRDLATHRTGLPALPANLFPANVADPYAGYTRQDLFAFLASYQPPAVSTPVYSPLDAALLGDLLGRAYATQYSSVLDATILQPLGLTHTSFADVGLLQGYARGQPAAHWHFSALAASAGLRSTLGDLLLFLQRNLQPRSSPLRAALLLARQPQIGSDKQDVGLGWHIVEVPDGTQTWPLVWRASVTAGFAVFVGFRTDRQEALALLGNSDADLSAIGIAWLQGVDSPPLPPPPARPLTAAELGTYPGLYQLRDGREIVVRVSDGGLEAQLRGEPSARLHAVAVDVFSAAHDAFVLSFQREGKVVTNLLFSQAGASFLAQRLSDHAPHIARMPLELDPAKSHEFAADYALNALTRVRVTATKQGLRMQMTGRAGMSLFTFAPDRFSSDDGSCELTFKRATDGTITGLSLDFAGDVRLATRLGPQPPASAAK